MSFIITPTGRKPIHKKDEEQLDEVLKASDPIEKWIRDFIDSDNPRFKGKSKQERIEMAKGAYYGAQKNEEVELDEAEKFSKSQLDRLRAEYGKIDTIDPTSPTYKKLNKFIDSMSKEQLKMIGDANIKWLSRKAKFRLKTMKEEYVVESINESKDFSAIYDNLKKKQEIEISYKSVMGGEKTGKFTVVSKNVVGKAKVGKVTLKSVDNPSGVKFYLYNRNGKVRLAIGDMGADLLSIKEEVELDEASGKEKMKEGMDPVNKDALKKKFKKRKDKDIDNDGDVDSSDEYLHKRRQAVSKAIAKEEVELEEARKKMGSDKPVNPKDLVVSLDDSEKQQSKKKPRGYKARDRLLHDLMKEKKLDPVSKED